MALFYSMIFAEMVHMRVKIGSSLEIYLGIGSRRSGYTPNQPRDARSGTSAPRLKHMGCGNSRFRRKSGACTSWTPKYPRQSFLKELQDLHIYCKMEIVREHVQGLMKLIALVGGLQNVKIQVAQIISL